MAGNRIQLGKNSKWRILVALTLLIVLCTLALRHFGFFESIGKGISFEETRISDGFAEESVPVSFTSYKSSDGQSLTVSGEMWETPEKAQQRFERLAKMAVSIIERKPILGPNQKQVGERLVGLLPSGDSFILRQDGLELRVIKAKSQKLALEFERQAEHSRR